MKGIERWAPRQVPAEAAAQPIIDGPAELGAGGWRWDVARGELHLSPEIRNLYEIAASVVPTSSVEDMYHQAEPEDRRRLLARIKDALKVGREGYEERFRAIGRDGNISHILTRGRLERDAQGRLVQVSGLDIDVTSLVENQESSEERYRELADFMPQIVWQTDAFGIIQYVKRGPRHRSRAGSTSTNGGCASRTAASAGY
jgi:PAS domain-containing protein